MSKQMLNRPCMAPVVFLRRLRVHALMMLSLAALSGCGPFVHRPVIASDLGASVLVRRVPAAIGVDYDPAFAAAEFVTTLEGLPGRRNDFLLAVGQPSIQFFDEILSAMFDKVVAISLPVGSVPQQQGVIGVLRPSIQAYFLALSVTPNESAHAECRITYQMPIHGVDGSLLATVTGMGSLLWPDIWMSEKNVANVVHETMRRAIASLIVNFYESPEVRGWLQAHETWPSDPEQR